jgi:transcriptional antiterminator
MGMERAKIKHNRAENVNLILKELLKTSLHGGCTLEELAELCNVSSRNVYRYLKDIEGMGFELVRPLPTKLAHGGKGRYKLSDKTIQSSQHDFNLLMLIGLYTEKERQYREQLNLINELFLRYLAAKKGLLLPFK